MIDRWIKDHIGGYTRLFIGALVLVLIVCAILMLSHCGGSDTDIAKQAEQTTKSGEAIQAAASDAIDTIGDRVATEHNIDQAVTDAQRQIDTATDPETVRSIVVASVCKQASHRNDPACVKR